MTTLDIFETKAYYNKWLKELTSYEKELILEMMEEYHELNTNNPPPKNENYGGVILIR